ncbi:MAG: hypothetical protein LBJ81_01465 [Puniceicoccales bacterium]|jgi:hypothetical protein|nr:hypothetical protein [Puniceicoccales bacterium]
MAMNANPFSQATAKGSAGVAAAATAAGGDLAAAENMAEGDGDGAVSAQENKNE